jgi:hypothetical protein
MRLPKKINLSKLFCSIDKLLLFKMQTVTTNYININKLNQRVDIKVNKLL